MFSPLCCRFVLFCGLLGYFGAPAAAQTRYEGRELIQRVQDDLQRVRAQGARSQKELERIDNARKHLSDVDRNLAKGKFDKDRVNEAIDDVKNVVENNTLEPADRDALSSDLADLRVFRDRRGH
jgi:hypothetical protein